MAAYLSLTEKATGKVYTGRALIELDERICAEVLNIEPDTEKWAEYWRGGVGVLMAFGQDKQYILDKYAEYPETVKIIHFLFDNFHNTSYYGR